MVKINQTWTYTVALRCGGSSSFSIPKAGGYKLAPGA